MLQTHDRYIDTRMIEFISRPQYTYGCSISALTAAFNYLYADDIGIKTSEELALVMGHSVHDIGRSKIHKNGIRLENKDMMEWFNLLCKHFKVKGTSTFYLQQCDAIRESKEREKENFEVISKFKKDIRKDNQAFIYHMENHYNVIVGYFEHANYPENAYVAPESPQRWIVIGEHSEYNRLENCIKDDDDRPEDTSNLIEDKTSGPIWCRKWQHIIDDLIGKEDSTHCIMVFKK